MVPWFAGRAVQPGRSLQSYFDEWLFGASRDIQMTSWCLSGYSSGGPDRTQPCLGRLLESFGFVVADYWLLPKYPHPHAYNHIRNLCFDCKFLDHVACLRVRVRGQIPALLALPNLDLLGFTVLWTLRNGPTTFLSKLSAHLDTTMRSGDAATTIRGGAARAIEGAKRWPSARRKRLPSTL